MKPLVEKSMNLGKVSRLGTSPKYCFNERVVDLLILIRTPSSTRRALASTAFFGFQPTLTRSKSRTRASSAAEPTTKSVGQSSSGTKKHPLSDPAWGGENWTAINRYGLILPFVHDVEDSACTDRHHGVR